MPAVPTRPLPGCFTGLAQPPDGATLVALAAGVGAWLSHRPAVRFTGPPCRADWQFPPPELLFSHGRPDARSDLYVLGVVLLALRGDPAAAVPPPASMEYAHWALDDGAARAWQTVADLDVPVREFFETCCARTRARRPADLDALRAALEKLWPAPAGAGFPAFRLRSPRLGPTAWLAAVRALPRWQVAGLALALGALAGLLVLYHR